MEIFNYPNIKRRGRNGRPHAAAVTLIGALSLFCATPSTAALAGFEPARDLNGDPLTLNAEGVYRPGVTTTFTSGAGRFLHEQYDWGGTGKWTVSAQTDNTTPGFGNQYSAITGMGAGGSTHYAVADAFAPLSITFAQPTKVASVHITNTTYAALSMANGDMFAKKFGGADGTDPDFLALSIEGLDGNAASTGTVEFMLADFRFSDSADDYILTDWASVSLAPLGTVAALAFSLTGSDVGAFGLNTPAYFALDNLSSVPLPPALVLLAPALGLIFRSRRQA